MPAILVLGLGMRGHDVLHVRDHGRVGLVQDCADRSVNWLCTCIAINLMLTIVFWINPVEKGGPRLDQRLRQASRSGMSSGRWSSA